ncbi:MAG: pseudouridine synthase [Dokdonella sp.]|nr:rRNA pseudouridine synthase [Dokdonella sp.]MCB1572022.1 rRNA pseudouridine synthase [Xanthomonadales bacterium]MCB1577676.1 rRNA pseudouridine synthase [Xanthomonadales bacterium]
MAKHGLARVISKRGICSRSQAEAAIRAGRVRVDGRIVSDPEARTESDARIIIDEASAEPGPYRYLMLNKPRGVVTTASDEHGRATVYQAFEEAGIGWVAPVGRLDKASEGLLLFSNDSAWAARITAPESQLEKTYHVQVDCLPDADLLARIAAGAEVDGERLAVVAIRELRRGAKNAWLEVVLDEGRNRQIRRLLSVFDIAVLRLVRVAIGSLRLGELGKGQFRVLDEGEVRALASPTR